MLDYDGVGLNTVKDHIRYLQHEYKFSDFYIIESTHGYNALCLDLLTCGLIYHIGNNVFSPADREFFKYGFYRDYYVLRFDRDKKLLKIMRNDSDKYEKSNAHRLFLEWFFDIKINKTNKFNDETKINIIQYPSKKNGYHYQEKSVPLYPYNEVFDSE